jgi:protein-tyrosine-phosphatase
MSSASPTLTKASSPMRVLLRHPAVGVVRNQARELWWGVRGASIVNPPPPAQIRSILFVCLGNICRSPFAARLASAKLETAGLSGIRCASAGLRTRTDARPPGDAHTAAAQFGVSLETCLPQSVCRELVEQHDIIVAMEAPHFWQLRRRFPRLADRVFLLSLFEDDHRSAYERYNIVDPFGQSQAQFLDCYRRIESAVNSLIASIRHSSARSSPADVGT